MRKNLMLIAFSIFTLYSFSQDIIIRTNGDSLNCKITKIDSSMVFFSFQRNGNEFSTSLYKNQIKDIIYESSSEQNYSDSITMKKVFGGYQFYQGDKKLKISQLVQAMEPNKQAYKEIQAAQSTYTIATIFGFAGGFLIGWPLGTAAAGGEPNWTLAGIGAGLIIVSIPISHKFNKQAKSAVDSFNGGLKASSFWDKTELRFAMSSNGIGLIIRF